MIPRDHITEWRQHAPWVEDAQVEQDLVICRALVEIFSHPLLGKSLAFRGGTALFKLHMNAARYSEDIDLVQVNSGPIGDVLDALQEVLNPWLGKPGRIRTKNSAKLMYRFESEDGVKLRLKVEINTREHFSIYGFKKLPFKIESSYFSGETEILTYELDELLGTKMRALYQRKKGRDLFDLWHAFIVDAARVDKDKVISSFLEYMKRGDHEVTKDLFEKNLSEKKNDQQFTSDIRPLLTAESYWDFDDAFDFVVTTLASSLP